MGINQLGCTRGDTEYPCIKTVGLGPCIGLVIRDPITTTTTVAHIAGLSGGQHKNNELMKDVVNCTMAMYRAGLRDFDRSQAEILLIGGWKTDTDERLKTLRYVLNELGFPAPKIDIRTPINGSSISFVIDSRTGVVSLLRNIVQTQTPEDLSFDMMRTMHKTAAGIYMTSDPRTLGGGESRRETYDKDTSSVQSPEGGVQQSYKSEGFKPLTDESWLQKLNMPKKLPQYIVFDTKTLSELVRNYEKTDTDATES